MSVIAEEERDTIVRNTIQQLEDQYLQEKRFLDDNGHPLFITDLDIENNCSLGTSDIQDSLRQLREEEFMVFDNVPMGYYFDSDQNPLNVTMIVRSRIFHTIWCLTKTEVVTQAGNFRNIGDWKYVRHVKKISERNLSLHEIHRDDQYPDVQNAINENSGFITGMIDYLMNNSNFEHISNFQKMCTVETLQKLIRNQSTEGLVFVAGTGQGKSFAYQFPLVIWILMKKLTQYNKLERQEITRDALAVNCSALLLFPRTALASDQMRSFTALIQIINDYIENTIVDNHKKNFLKIKKIVEDHSEGNGEDADYLHAPDIIISTQFTLERRLSNPLCNEVFHNGIDIVLYDEVHTNKGVSGAEIAALNVRVENYSRRNVLFIGMSATIDKPDEHCQKLFALRTRPRVVQEDPALLENGQDFTIEHHLMLKPAGGRDHAGVTIESTSCLLHNRRSLRDNHDEEGVRTVDQRTKPKTISFFNSLDGAAKYEADINDYENYFGKNKFGSTGGTSKPEPPNMKPTRKYYFYCKPRKGQSYNSLRNCYDDQSCDDCIDKTQPHVLDCSYYRQGKCWYYSEDDSNQFNQTRWSPSATPHPICNPPTWMPYDNIRSKRVSSKDPRQTNVEDYFTDVKTVYDRDPSPVSNQRLPHTSGNIHIDNVVATPTLELGVDVNHVEEIIQFGSIDSPSSYKQKAGRGAREGNMDNGLFVMSIIDSTPTSYFHFKHFEVLIQESLDPIRLEVLNQNVIDTHLFRSIFDFLAKRNINLFRIRPTIKRTWVQKCQTANRHSDRLEHHEIQDQFRNAIQILNTPDLRTYLNQFLNKIGIGSNQQNKVNTTIEYARNFLNELGTEIELEIRNNLETRTLYDYLVRSVEDRHYLQAIADRYSGAAEVNNAKRELRIALESLESGASEYFSNNTEFQEEIEKIRREIESG